MCCPTHHAVLRKPLLCTKFLLVDRQRSSSWQSQTSAKAANECSFPKMWANNNPNGTFCYIATPSVSQFVWLLPFPGRWLWMIGSLPVELFEPSTLTPMVFNWTHLFCLPKSWIVKNAVVLYLKKMHLLIWRVTTLFGLHTACPWI